MKEKNQNEKFVLAFLLTYILGEVEIKLTKRKEENYSHLVVRGSERKT